MPASGDGDLQQDVIPKTKAFVIVLAPEQGSSAAAALRRELPRALRASGLELRKFSFRQGSGSSRATRDALVLWAKRDVLFGLAEQCGLPKKINQGRQGCVGPLWEPYSPGRLKRYVGDDSPDTFFSEIEVLDLLRHSIFTVPTAAVMDQCTASEIAAIKNAQLHHRAMRAAERLGVVEATLAFHDPVRMQDLRNRWSPWRPFTRLPDVELAEYFGPQAVHYFVFVQQYAQLLLVPAAIGLLTMAGCALSGGFFDEELTQAAAAQVTTPLVMIWATLFIERWKRTLNTTRRNFGYHIDEGRAELLVPTKEAQDIAGRHRAVVKATDYSGLRYMWTISAMCLLIGVTSVVIHLLLVVGDIVEGMSDNLIVQNSPLALYMAVVEVFQRVYTHLATWLTDREGHTMRAGYMKSLTLKSAFFQLINYHGWFLYLAFWRQDLPYLRSQLLIFFTVKQVIGNVLEVVLPMLQAAPHEAHHDKGTNDCEPVEAGSPSRSPSRYRGLMSMAAGKIGSSDNIEELLEEHYALAPPSSFDDYLEMSVMFAALVLYFPVYPLGGLLALLHAVFENASDAYKYCVVQRRAVPDPMDDELVEVWLQIFDAISYLGVCSSIALIWVEPGGWTGFQLILVEHFLLFFKSYLSWSIPDCPEWIEAEEVSSMELLRSSSPVHLTSASVEADSPEMLEVRPVAVQGLPPRLGGLLQRHPVIRLRHGDTIYNTKVVAEREITSPPRAGSSSGAMSSGSSLASDSGVLPESSWQDAFWFSLPFRPGADLVAEVLSEEHGLLTRRTKYVVLGSATFPANALPRGGVAGAPTILTRPLHGESVMDGATVTLELRCL